MRVSISLDGFAPAATTLPAIIEADRLGLDGVWTCEHIGGHDAMVTSAVYLAKTEGLDIGMVGLAPQTRHPGMTATEIGSLAEFGPGRVRVQVGTGDPSLIAKLGYSVSRPLSTVESFVGTLRDTLEGEAMDRQTPHGDFVGFQRPPYPTPIDVLAIRPKMLRLAAQIGDGVSLSIAASKTYLRESVRQIEDDLAEFGRSRADFRITALAFGIIAPDPYQVAAAFAPGITMFPVDSSEVLLAGEVDASDFYAAMRAGDIERAAGLATAEHVLAVSFAATPDTVADELAAYADTGIDELAIMLMGPPPAWVPTVQALAAGRDAFLSR